MAKTDGINKLHRGNIEGFPESCDTETDKLIKGIVEKTHQVAVNRQDEVEVMRCMLNDDDFKVAIWDRKKGYQGSRSPRAEALGIAVDALSGATGMSTVEAYNLANQYQFTKKDAQRFINISKDFMGTYLQTGRKVSISNDPRGESMVNARYIEPREKSIPDRDNPGKTKTKSIGESIKIVATNKR